MSTKNLSMGSPTPIPKRPNTQVSESDSELDITYVAKKSKIGRPSTEEIINDKIKKMTDELMKLIASKDVIINGLIDVLKHSKRKKIQKIKVGTFQIALRILLKKLNLLNLQLNELIS